MRIEFTEQEVESLPESIREKVKDNVFEGEPDGIVEDVTGLKSALEKTREEKKSGHQTLSAIRENLGLEDGSDIIPTINRLKTGAEQSSASKKELADERMKTAIAEADGNVFALPAVVRERMQWSDDLGHYFVPAEDGEPLKNDDGSLKGVDDVVAQMKKDSAFSGLFRGTSQSGSGSEPQKGGDGPAHTNETLDGLPPTSKARSQMTRQEKVQIAKAGEDFERWPI